MWETVSVLLRQGNHEESLNQVLIVRDLQFLDFPSSFFHKH